MITTLTGPNEFELFRSLREITKAFVAEYGDIALERISGPQVSADDVSGALDSVPFLSNRKLVVVDRPSQIPGWNENFQALLEQSSDSVDVVIVEPTLDKRTSYAKFLKQQSNYQDFSVLDDRQLPAWAVQYAKEQGATLSVADARYLVQRVGANQALLAQEIIKLSTYNPTITKQSINELTNQAPQSSIFELMDRAFRGDIKTALRIYDEQRSQKVEPAMIIGLLAQQLYLFSLALSAPRSISPAAVAKQSGVHPYAMQKATEVAHAHMSKELLTRHLEELRAIDNQIKTTKVDSDDALMAYIISLGTRQQSR
jgi:DNA polymerase III subunit delta